MQKILNYAIISVLTILGISWFLWICEWQIYYYWWTELPTSMTYYPQNNKTGVDLGNDVTIKGKNTIIVRLLEVFWLDNSMERDLKFIDYAKAIMNLALWLVAFIALITSIYTFYMMFFTENEAWIKKAKENLVGIFIALAIIWLAWIIVSFIFWWYQSNWERANLFEVDNTSFNYNTNTIDNQIYLTI